MKRLLVLVAAAACLAFAATAVSGAAATGSPQPFAGTWWAIDLDGSLQQVTFGARGTLVYRDSYASVCAQAVPGLQSYTGLLRDTGTVAGGVWTGSGKAMFGCPAAKFENGPHLLKFVVAGGMLRGGFGADPNGMYWYTWTRERPVNPFTGEWGAIDPVDGPITLEFGLGGSMRLTDPLSTACGHTPGSTSGTGLITWDAATNTYTWTGNDLLWVCQTTPPGPFAPFTLKFVFHDGTMTGGWPGQFEYTWTRTSTAAPGISVSGAGFVAWPDTPSPGVTTTELAVVGAQLSPTGRVSGMIAGHSPYGFAVATVTCLKVVGDTVYVGGLLKPGFNVYNGTTYGQMAYGIKDGGPQGDLITGGLYLRTDVNTCEKLSNLAPDVSVHPGNFVVKGI